MEIEKENYPADETDLEESLNQTGFLLQRLRELQAWQQEQERQLLREQELQIGRLCSANNQVIAFFWSCSLKIVLKIWHSCNLTPAFKCNYCIIYLNYINLGSRTLLVLSCKTFDNFVFSRLGNFFSVWSRRWRHNYWPRSFKVY